MEELKELVAALPAYLTAESYYYNTVPELFASTKIQTMLQTTADRFRLNYAATPIDVLTERTVINGITCTTSQAQSVVNTLWETQQLGILAKDLHRSVYTYGDSYLLAWTNEAGGLSVFVHDPKSVRVFYDIEDPTKKIAAIHTWVGEDDFLYVARYDEFQAIILKSTTTADSVDPETVQFVQTASVPNPVPGLIPVFHFRNGGQYGRPEHADAFGPQDMVNKLTVTMMASIDHAGFPQRYILTDSGLDSGATADFSDDTEAPRYDSGPGTNWLLTGSNLKVGQFEVAESANFLKPIESLVRQMSVVTDTPMHYFDLSGEPPSGAALRAADFPLNKKANDRQARLAVTWREFFDFALTFSATPADVMILWAPPGIVDDKEFWETQLLKQQLGVPIEELLREGGYTDALIEEFNVQSVIPTPQEGINGNGRPDGGSIPGGSDGRAADRN